MQNINITNNSYYVPTTDKDKRLFEEIQTHMCSIFGQTSLAYCRKLYARKYEAMCNTQYLQMKHFLNIVWKELKSIRLI